jgi:hypothetical protein
MLCQYYICEINGSTVQPACQASSLTLTTVACSCSRTCSMEKASYKGTDIFIKALRSKNATAAYPKKEVKPSIKRKTTLRDCVITIARILLPNSVVNRGPISESMPLIRAGRLNKIPKVWSEIAEVSRKKMFL